MAQVIIREGKIKLLPYTAAELAGIYEVCDRTFKKWIRPFEHEIGPRQGRYYTIAQVKIILEKLGLPAEITTEP